MNKELRVSFDVLQKVYFEGAYASIQLNKVLTDDFSRSLVTKIVYGVLEQDIYLQYVVNGFVKRAPKDSVMLLMKMAAYIGANINSIPHYALVNECVEIAKQLDKYSAGFVNATIKNILRTPVKLPNPNVNFVKYLSVKYSYPEWYINILLKDFDKKFVEELLKFKPTSDTHIRVVGQLDKLEQLTNEFVLQLQENNIRFTLTPVKGCMYVDYLELLKAKELHGKYVVQGLPSIITALSVGAKAGDKVLDATAAPGGKACLIAGLHGDVRVTACDVHAHRVTLIKNYAQGLKLNNVVPILCDATVYQKEWQELFDCVLCDVPCSGMGVVTKKPDILLNREQHNINELAGLQYQILSNNAKYVKSGGTLLYSTCSILPQENNKIINKFLAANPQWELQPINTYGINVTCDNNMYTFYPHLSHTEGFFIARMVRK